MPIKVLHIETRVSRILQKSQSLHCCHYVSQTFAVNSVIILGRLPPAVLLARVRPAAEARPVQLPPHRVGIESNAG